MPARGLARALRRLRPALGAGLLLAACALSLSPHTARAEDDATTTIARERFKEGVQYFDQKQYDKSRAAFLQAYALKRHPAVLLNLAQSELRSGHEADAAKHFSQYLREAKDATDSERQSAESGLSASKAVVAEVTVNVDEEGAAVSVDGTSEGQTPLPGPVYLAPGSHTITAKKEGRDVSVEVKAVAGQASSTSLRFKKAAGAAPAPTPEADKEEPKTEKEEPKAEPEATPPSSGEPSSPATSEAESRRKPFFKWAAHSPVALVGGVVAVAGIGSAVGFAIAAKHSYNNADSAAAQIRTAVAEDAAKFPAFGADPANICTNSYRQGLTTRPQDYVSACKTYRDNVDTGNTFKTVSIVSWAVAGAAVAGTAIAYLVDGKEPVESARENSNKSSATVVPWLSGTERGVFVTGSF